LIRILFIGDIVGEPGRRAVSTLIGALRCRLDAHLVVANGENAAGGLGITKPTAKAILDAGADVITLGNHSFSKKDMHDFIKTEPRIIRPANYPPGVPGRGWGVFDAITRDKVAVVNLLGRTFMTPVDCPFRAADAALEDIGSGVKSVFVDIHAEATSEKKAMGYYLEGRATAVVGTHTHIQTSDECVLPGGTAYITDAGMTGVHESVLGLDKSVVISRFLTQVTNKFELAEGTARVQGVLVSLDPATGRAASIERVNESE
jgi:2',3'-cyclic-nucleotide 2'-phosphodiesterase